MADAARRGAESAGSHWHEEQRERIIDEQRRTVVLIKDVWHRRPGYPAQAGGLGIRAAVIDDGERTPAASPLARGRGPPVI